MKRTKTDSFQQNWPIKNEYGSVLLNTASLCDLHVYNEQSVAVWTLVCEFARGGALAWNEHSVTETVAYSTF